MIKIALREIDFVYTVHLRRSQGSAAVTNVIFAHDLALTADAAVEAQDPLLGIELL